MLIQGIQSIATFREIETQLEKFAVNARRSQVGFSETIRKINLPPGKSAPTNTPREANYAEADRYKTHYQQAILRNYVNDRGQVPAGGRAK